MVERGHRKRCNKRKSGERPYLYRDGKRESEYIKLTDVERFGFSRPAVRAAK